MHNIKPEILPKILAILDENPEQTTGRLYAKSDSGRECFCIEGIVCEAYRREHPDNARWDRYGTLNLNGEAHSSNTPQEVRRWAYLQNRKDRSAISLRIGSGKLFDAETGVALNDGYDWTWDDFRAAFAKGNFPELLPTAE